MRNLTLGVLIVSGGTLAALPFRRIQTDRGSLDASVRPTGPSVTPLDTSSVEVTFNHPAGTHATMIGSRPWQPGAVTEPMHGERFIEMPESFGRDLAPLPKPQSVADRFSASVEYQSQASAARQATDHAAVMSADLASMQSPGRRGPLIGGAMSSSVPVVPHRFSELAVGPAGETLTPAPKISAGAARDSLVSNPSNRGASPALEAVVAPERIEESAPPLPAPQAERQKTWIRQPN